MITNKQVVNATWLSLCCFFYAFLAVAGETDPRKLREIQQAQEDELRALMQSGANGTDESRKALSTTAKFLPTDADDDGMDDAWETANGLNPNDPNDAWLDPDNDQVVNLFEYQLGSNLNDAATPAVITVAASGTAGALFTDVAQAIEVAGNTVPGKVVRVAGGSYPVNYLTRETKVVMVQGGWSLDFTNRDLKLYPTTFDGGLAGEIIYFQASSGKPVMVFDGINFINGKGDIAAAINLWAEGDAYMRTSLFNCSISNSEAGLNYGVLAMHNRNTSESDRTIANTVIGGNGGSGIYAQIVDDTAARWRIINTTISNNKNIGSNGYGIDAFTLNNGVLNANVSNSILWGDDQSGLKLSGTLGVQGTINFNLSYANLDSDETSLGAVISRRGGILNADPLFIDPTAANYHLQAGSPMIDAGTNIGVPPIDFEGEARPSGTAVDIGADELVVPEQ